LEKKTIEKDASLPVKKPFKNNPKKEKPVDPVQKAFDIMQKQSKMTNQLSDLVNVMMEEIEGKTPELTGFIKSVRIKFNEVKQEIYDIKGIIEINKYNVKNENN